MVKIPWLLQKPWHKRIVFFMFLLPLKLCIPLLKYAWQNLLSRNNNCYNHCCLNFVLSLYFLLYFDIQTLNVTYYTRNATPINAAVALPRWLASIWDQWLGRTGSRVWNRDKISRPFLRLLFFIRSYLPSHRKTHSNPMDTVEFWRFSLKLRHRIDVEIAQWEVKVKKGKLPGSRSCARDSSSSNVYHNHFTLRAYIMIFF